MSASDATALKSGVRLIERKIDEMTFFDCLLVSVEEGRRLVPAVEHAKRVTIDERRRGRGETDHAGVKIFDYFGKAIEDGSMRFVKNYEVEKSGGKTFIANAH